MLANLTGREKSEKSFSMTNRSKYRLAFLWVFLQKMDRANLQL